MPRPSVIKRHPFYHSGRVLIITCGCTLTLAFCAQTFYRPSFLAHLDGRFFDGLIAEEAVPKGYSGPLVVALDNDSLARFGRWPWPRALMARLLTRIADQKPASVGIDAIFAEPERPGDRGKGSAPADNLSAGDVVLSKALSSGPFVLGFELTFAPENTSTAGEKLLHPLNIVSVREQGAMDPLKRLWQATGDVSSLPVFSRSVDRSGFLNASRESDGILRRMPVLIAYGGKVYPSLALATALGTDGGTGAVLESTWSGDRILKIGGRNIPLDDRGRLLLRFRGWHGASKPLSAAALLEGRIPHDALKGRVVFIGATATGMGESVVTPVNALLSGVQVHAIAAENMLQGDFARPAPWVYRFLAVLVLGLAATFTCIRLPVMRGALVLGAAAVWAWQGSTWLYRADGFFLSPVLPVVALFANFSLLTLIRTFFVEKRAQRQKRDLAKARDFIMSSLASLAEIRDTETGAHIMRTERYLLILCRELSRHPRFKPLLNQETIELISKLAPLHDIGKVGLPDHLLRKTTGFTSEEYEAVKKHVIYGRDAIAKAEVRVGLDNDEMLQYAKDMAYSHHERWDGSGYPEGLQGEQIPWAGRLMALADAYDAMVSRRIYKDPIPHEEAVRFISKGRGTLFDPDMVDAFLRSEAEWRQISCNLADPAGTEMEGEGK
jgi:HD-GYP domain-containing protein (c-di-GMP phosphodiesterase class II)